MVINMDLFPLWNSLRIAIISSVIAFFLGIFFAYYVAKLPRYIKGLIDVFLTIPLVLPPTVVGYLILRFLGPKRFLGKFLLEKFNLTLTMSWQAAVISTVIIVFPLMYRTARGAFEAYDQNLSEAGRTLGLSDTFIFWKIEIPNCMQGIIAGIVLCFARAIGEYGATSMVSGYIPSKTTTISTTVYHLWQTGNDMLAFRWVLINIFISAIVLTTINFVERKNKN